MFITLTALVLAGSVSLKTSGSDNDVYLKFDSYYYCIDETSAPTDLVFAFMPRQRLAEVFEATGLHNCHRLDNEPRITTSALLFHEAEQAMEYLALDRTKWKYNIPADGDGFTIFELVSSSGDIVCDGADPKPKSRYVFRSGFEY